MRYVHTNLIARAGSCNGVMVWMAIQTGLTAPFSMTAWQFSRRAAAESVMISAHFERWSE